MTSNHLKIFTSKSTSQIKQKFEEMIIGWSPFKILSDDQPLSKIATVTKYRNFEREKVNNIRNKILGQGVLDIFLINYLYKSDERLQTVHECLWFSKLKLSD